MKKIALKIAFIVFGVVLLLLGFTLVSSTQNTVNIAIIGSLTNVVAGVVLFVLGGLLVLFGVFR